MNYFQQIKDLSNQHKLKSLSRTELVSKTAVVLNCLLFDMGFDKKDADVIALILRLKIKNDDWK